MAPSDQAARTGFRRTIADARLPGQFGRVDLAGPLRLHGTSTGDSAFAITVLHLHDAVPGQVNPRTIEIAHAEHGHVWATSGHEGALHLTPALFSPTSPFVTSGGDRGRVTIVTLEQAPLDRLARAVYGPGVHADFESPLPVSASSGRSWRALVDLLTDLPLRTDLVRTKAHHAVGLLALEAFRVRGDPAERRRAVRARGALLRAAVDFIHDHAAEPIGVADVALEIGVGITELRRLFSVHSADGATPEQTLRRARLEGAHRALASADPSSTSVRSIALQWGFVYPGRFVREYLAAFRRLPDETLAESGSPGSARN